MNFNEFLFSHFLYKMIAEQPKTHLEPRLTAFYRGQTRLTKTTHRLITFCYELMIRVLTGNDSLITNLVILPILVDLKCAIIVVALEFGTSKCNSYFLSVNESAKSDQLLVHI